MESLFGILCFWLGAAIFFIGPIVGSIKAPTMIEAILVVFGCLVVGGVLGMGVAKVNFSYEPSFIVSRGGLALSLCSIALGALIAASRPLPTPSPLEDQGHRE